MKAEIFLPEDYRPAEDESFMNDRQIEYFRRKLNAWKTEILKESLDTIEGMKDGVTRPNAATSETLEQAGTGGQFLNRPPRCAVLRRAGGRRSLPADLRPEQKFMTAFLRLLRH